MQFTKRDFGYTVYARLEESLRSWVSETLLTYFGQEWRSYIPEGTWEKGLERLPSEHMEDIEDPLDLLEETDLTDLMEIACYKGNFEIFCQSDMKQNEFRALMLKLYDIRCKIAHIKSYFSALDLEVLREIAEKLIPIIGSSSSTIRETLDGLDSNPERVVIHMPETLFLVEPQGHSQRINNLPPSDYDIDGGFIGRKDDLKKVSDLVLGGLHRVVTIAGAGGVGKTALAHRFCQHLLARPDFPFDGIVWVSAKEERLTLTGIELIEPGLRNYEGLLDSILETFGWQDSISKPIAEKEEDVQTILRAGEKGVLLVVDNLETIRDENIYEFLKDFPPPSRVLITSRLGLGEVERRYALKEMTTKDAVAMLRTVAREKGASGLATLPDEVLSRYVERMARYPLAIKWVVGQVALGKDIDLVVGDLTSSTGDVAKFCFDRIFDEMLTDDARMVLYSLAAHDSPLVRGVLVHISNLSKERLDDALNLLTVASLVVPDHKKSADGGIETTYGLLPLTRNYLRAKLHAQPDIHNQIRARVEMVENLIEESERAGQSYSYSLRDMGAQTPEERIAATWALTGFQKYNSGDYVGAVEAFEKAQQIAPKFPAIYRNWAAMESEAGYHEKAEELIREATRLAPKDAGLWFVWGNMEKRRRRYDRAYEYLSKARELAPNDVPILGALGEVEKRRGRFQQAAELLLQALEDKNLTINLSRPRHEAICYTSLADTYRRWAESFARNKQWNDSRQKLLQAYEYAAKAVERAPEDYRAQETLREVSLDLGIRLVHSSGLEEGKPYLLEAIKESPKRWKDRKTTVTACYYLAKSHLEEGHLEAAKKYFQMGRKYLWETSTFIDRYRELGAKLGIS